MNKIYAVSILGRKKNIVDGGVEFYTELHPRLIDARSYDEAIGYATRYAHNHFPKDDGWEHTIGGVEKPLKFWNKRDYQAIKG